MKHRARWVAGWNGSGLQHEGVGPTVDARWQGRKRGAARAYEWVREQERATGRCNEAIYKHHRRMLKARKETPKRKREEGRKQTAVPPSPRRPRSEMVTIRHRLPHCCNDKRCLSHAVMLTDPIDAPRCFLLPHLVPSYCVE